MIGAGLAVLALIIVLIYVKPANLGILEDKALISVSSGFRNWNIDYLVKYLLCHTTFLELKNRRSLLI
jgi:hypothetical protein